MKKNCFLFAGLVLLLSLFIGCGQSSSQPAAAPAPAAPAASAAPGDDIMNATDWPAGPIEFFCHAAAGGDSDFNARTFARYFEQITGKPMIITNMPGGGGTIVTSHVKNLPPDGTKGLFVHTGPMVINKVSGMCDYDFRDFDVICIPAINTSYVLAASKKSGFKTMADLAAKTKATPNTVIYGAELGGWSHLQGYLLNSAIGAPMRIIDSGSGVDKVMGLLGGRIDVGAVGANSVMDYTQTGEITIIGAFNHPRNQYLDVPTFVEQGINFKENVPYVMAFAKGTDPKIVAKMDEISRRICEIPQYAEDIKKGFMQPVIRMGRDEAIKFMTDLSNTYGQYQDKLR
jgi:tripartite-type tricarboxylate transporter receptor subunit TctC